MGLNSLYSKGQWFGVGDAEFGYDSRTQEFSELERGRIVGFALPEREEGVREGQSEEVRASSHQPNSDQQQSLQFAIIPNTCCASIIGILNSRKVTICTQMPHVEPFLDCRATRGQGPGVLGSKARAAQWSELLVHEGKKGDNDSVT